MRYQLHIQVLPCATMFAADSHNNA